MWRGKNLRFEDEIEKNTGGFIYGFMCGIHWQILFNILRYIAIKALFLGVGSFGVGEDFMILI